MDLRSGRFGDRSVLKTKTGDTVRNLGGPNTHGKKTYISRAYSSVGFHQLNTFM